MVVNNGGHRPSTSLKEIDMGIEQMWDTLTENGVSEDTLQIITNINGYSAETLNSVCYAKFGYHDVAEDNE
jgi:hypothetical protein